MARSWRHFTRNDVCRIWTQSLRECHIFWQVFLTLSLLRSNLYFSQQKNNWNIHFLLIICNKCPSKRHIMQFLNWIIAQNTFGELHLITVVIINIGLWSSINNYLNKQLHHPPLSMLNLESSLWPHQPASLG